MVLGVVTHGSILSLLLLSVFSLFHMSESETRGLHFLNNCSGHKVHDVSPELSYMVSWDGKQMPSESCKLSFSGPIGDTIYTRSVCYDTIFFSVKDCHVQLEFSEEGGTKAMNYSCTHKPKVWCADNNHRATINLLGANSNQTTSSSFRILVTAQKTNTLLYLKIGISVGLVSLCLVGILVAVCCFKKKQKVVKDSELDYTRLAE